MRRRYAIATGLAILIIAVAAIVIAMTRMTGTPMPKPAIGMEPQNVGKLDVNDTFTVNVTVENCVDIYAVQVDLRYDPQVLNVTNILEGPFLPSAGSTFAVNMTAQSLNTTPPTTRLIFVDTKMGSEPAADASGNGTLLTITCQVLSNGSTQLQFYPYSAGTGTSIGTYFLKRDLTEIIPELHNGSYGSSPIIS